MGLTTLTLLALVAATLVLSSAGGATNQGLTASLVATPTSIKTGGSVSFDASGSSDSSGNITTWKIDFGDNQGTGDMDATANPLPTALMHQYTSVGTYTATLTLTDDQQPTPVTDTNTVSVIVTDNQPPTASLTRTLSPTSGKVPVTAHFDASGSTDSDGTIKTWKLDFGDGSSTGDKNTATDPLPSDLSHTYTSACSCTATLTVTDDSGVSSSTSVGVNAVANQPPTASLTTTQSPANGKVPLLVHFNASGSTDSDGTIKTWKLDFGDGSSTGDKNTATDPLPSDLSHTYTSACSCTATLTVTDDSGVSSSTSVRVNAVANRPPTASLSSLPTPATGKVPLLIHFNASGSGDPDGTIKSWSIDFGDNSSTGTRTDAPSSDVQHTYTTATNRTATLTVTDDNGVSSQAQVSVTPLANQAPHASLTSSPTPANGKVGMTVTFNGSNSSDPDGVISSWSLDYGDGSPVDSGFNTPPISISHQYAKAGSFTATLTVKDDGPNQLTNSATVPVNVAANKAPTAVLTSAPSPASGAAPLNVSFTGTGSSDSDGNVVSWTLDFGDGNSTSGGTALPSNLGHQYAAGSYTAKLTVTDNDGATAQSTVSVNSNSAPVAVMTATPTPATGTAPLDVTFNGSGSHDAEGAIASYTLDFGDGTTPASGSGPPPASIQHQYKNARQQPYTATLTVKDSGNLTSTATVTVTVNDAPKISVFDPAPILEGQKGSTKTLTFLVRLSAPSPNHDVTVDYTTQDGTATSPDDYVASKGTLTIKKGDCGPSPALACQVTVTINGDNIDENDETFSLVLSNPQFATIDRGQASAVILDDDAPPDLILEGADALISHDHVKQMLFKIDLCEPSADPNSSACTPVSSGKPVTVTYETLQNFGSAKAGVDYTYTLAQVTIPPGNQTGTASVDIMPKTVFEPNKTVFVQLSNPVNSNTRGTQRSVGNIINDLNPSAATVVTGDATSIGITSAHVTGTVNPQNQATTAYVFYGLTTNYGTWYPRAPSVGPGMTVGSDYNTYPVSFDLSGLLPGTVYHYTIVGAHGQFDLSSGADKTFKTLPLPTNPPPVPPPPPSPPPTIPPPPGNGGPTGTKPTPVGVKLTAPRTVKVTKQGDVPLTLSCVGDAVKNCRSRVELDDQAGAVIGAKTFTIPAGSLMMVRVRLNRKGMKELVRKRTLKVDLTVSTPDGIGGITVLPRSLKLAAPPKPKPKPTATRRH